MEVWISYKDGKVAEQVLCEDGKEPIFSTSDKDSSFVKADRQGDLASEIFDPATGTWSEDPNHAAFIVDFDLGKTFIENSHIEKSIEAKLIIAGYEFEGLLTREAAMLGIPVLELAQEVRQKAMTEEDKEIERRRIKAGISSIL
jgi:hypothetical protein